MASSENPLLKLWCVEDFDNLSTQQQNNIIKVGQDAAEALEALGLTSVTASRQGDVGIYPE